MLNAPPAGRYVAQVKRNTNADAANLFRPPR
jgi:hypothetical protein